MMIEIINFLFSILKKLSNCQMKFTETILYFVIFSKINLFTIIRKILNFLGLIFLLENFLILLFQSYCIILSDFIILS